MKFGNAIVKPYIAVNASQTEPESLSEHARAAALVSCEMTDLFAAGRSLRAEAEEFVTWARWMGERDGSQSWGPVQREYAEKWRARYRARAQEFKAAATGREIIVERVWSGRIRLDYDEAVTEAARAELQI